MFRIQPLTAGMPHHVTGKHMVVFVESERFAMNHIDHLCNLNNKAKHSHPYPPSFSHHNSLLFWNPPILQRQSIQPPLLTCPLGPVTYQTKPNLQSHSKCIPLRHTLVMLSILRAPLLRRTPFTHLQLTASFLT